MSTTRDFICSHADEGWPPETWRRIDPSEFETPHSRHVERAASEAEDRRQHAAERDAGNAAAGFVSAQSASLPNLLRAAAATGEADAAGHIQVTCPDCGWNERLLARDYATLTEWCDEVGADAIPLRSVQKLLRLLGVL